MGLKDLLLDYEGEARLANAALAFLSHLRTLDVLTFDNGHKYSPLEKMGFEVRCLEEARAIIGKEQFHPLVRRYSSALEAVRQRIEAWPGMFVKTEEWGEVFEKLEAILETEDS